MGMRFLPIIQCGIWPIWRIGPIIYAKVSPIDGVFRPTNISKIIFPNKNQLLPPCMQDTFARARTRP